VIEAFNSLLEYLKAQPLISAGLTIFSLASLILGAIGTPWIVSRMRPDFFTAQSWRQPLPLLVLKNTMGFVLLLAGAAMLFLPGQGLITILLGLAIMNFPYKYRLLNMIARQPAVWSALNQWRRKYGKEEFIKPNGEQTSINAD
jgi:hypothetical protein